VNSIELRPLPHGGHGYPVVHVFIDGRDLLELVRRVELPQAAADAQPELAVSYQGLSPEEWKDLPEQYGDGRAAVLCCECGEAACWPLRVRITWRKDTVVWSDFEQPHRGWTYEKLGPFVFRREEYERAVAAVAGRAA
jgi:hypothetical protein